MSIGGITGRCAVTVEVHEGEEEVQEDQRGRRRCRRCAGVEGGAHVEVVADLMWRCTKGCRRCKMCRRHNS